MRNVGVYISLVLAMLVLAVSANGDTTAKPQDVNIAPPAAAGAIEHVTLILPAADASASLTVDAVRRGNSIRYTITNPTDEPIVLWVRVLYQGGNQRDIWIMPNEMATLKKNEKHVDTLVFRPDAKGRLYGEYRILTAACPYKAWGDITTQTRTDAGKKVDAALAALDKRIEEARHQYGH